MHASERLYQSIGVAVVLSVQVVEGHLLGPQISVGCSHFIFYSVAERLQGPGRELSY